MFLKKNVEGVQYQTKGALPSPEEALKIINSLPNYMRGSNLTTDSGTYYPDLGKSTEKFYGINGVTFEKPQP